MLGFVTPGSVDHKITKGEDLPIGAAVVERKKVRSEKHISEVGRELDKPNHERLLDIITYANGSPVSLKISPDMYEVVSGLAKTEQIAGLPLIHINPEIMSQQQKFAKRLIDVITAFIILTVFSPLWILFSLAIK